MITPLLLAAAAALGSSQGCHRCKSTGTLACGRHEGEAGELEASVLFCSVAAACEDCAGGLRVDCPVCDGGPDSAVLDQDRARVREWMQASRLESLLGRPVPRLESERFELVVETGDRREGRKRIDQHTLGHWVAADLERAAALVAEHYAVTEKDYSSKMRLWIWNEAGDHSKVMGEFLGSTGTGDFSLLGRRPVFSVWTEPGNFDTVEKIRTLFVHRAGHMLISNLMTPYWIGDVGGGWLDAGVGHWYEYAVFGRSLHYCAEEATAATSYGNGQWRADLRKLLEREDGRLLPGLLAQNVGAMTARDQALCWSFYDYLVEARPSALRPMLADLKAKRPTREVFAEHLGMGVLEAEDAWRAWVPTRYPKKGDDPLPRGER